MVKRADFDRGRDIDWGKASADYARYRSGPPPSLYRALQALDIGLAGQRVLDQGTGTGVFGRQLAKQGCSVVGTDPSSEQIRFARELAAKEGHGFLSVVFSATTFSGLRVSLLRPEPWARAPGLRPSRPCGPRALWALVVAPPLAGRAAPERPPL